LFCILANIGLFTFLFRRELDMSYDTRTLARAIPPHPRWFRFTLAALCLIALGYVAASAVQFPLSLVALGGSGLLLLGAWHYGSLDWRRMRAEISWSLFVFVGGMFIVVRGVENLGLTAAFGQALIQVAGNDPLRAVMLTAGGTALGANLINNVPMALVMTSTLGSLGANIAHPALVYATILGADLGPNLTTVGSVATMLWLLILRRKGLEISTLEYFKLGVTVVPVMIIVGAFLIWLRL
jgi:arsenical pump membrane protein